MFFVLKTSRHFQRFALALAAVLWLAAATGFTATLTLQTNVIGLTPEILGYNSGHFFTNSNTRDWWRYAGVSGARVFMSPSDIEATDDLAPVGDGVTNQTTFIARRAALRAAPLNTNFINWSYFSNRYETVDLGVTGNNHLRVNYCLRELRALGVSILAQITASTSRLPITNANDWGGKWELWQHYYAQAFYLGRTFDVQRFQMYNEPDAVPLANDDFLQRLQLASDAIQAAQADVNALFGKSLTPLIFAPVNAGTADSDIAQLGGVAVTNRHVNYLGVTDTNWWNLHRYDYHQYSGGASGFSGDLVNLHNYLTAAMAPEPRFLTTISEFNTRTGANFDTTTNTLDTPSEYATFAAICVALASNQCSELYAFKFSQTERTGGTYPVAKNAMHYVDNNNAPYNVGGLTRAGEAYRLFNKAFAAGRNRLGAVKGSGATSFEVHASYDPQRQRYFFYSVNDTASNVPIDFIFTNLPVSAGNAALLEEVSESSYGGARLWTNIPAGKMFSAGTQSSNTVWLLTLPAAPQTLQQTLLAAEDTEVRDGVNRTNNYNGAASLAVRNDGVTTTNRSVAFLKFNLAGINVADIELAALSLNVATLASNVTAQAHVFEVDTNNWSAATLTWSNAPNLRQNVAAGNTIARQFVSGAGNSAAIAGQLVANNTVATEKIVDVTEILRGQTNGFVSFLIAQEPRWDVALPSLVAGDTQPDGLKISSLESGSGPRLRLALRTIGAPNPPVITGIALQPDRRITLQFSGATNRTHWLQATTNLAAGVWQNISTNLSGTNGSWSVTDDRATNLPLRFYRAVLP